MLMESGEITIYPLNNKGKKPFKHVKAEIIQNKQVDTGKKL